MSVKIVLTQISLKFATTGNQRVTVKYRKTADPDVGASYALASDTVQVKPDGDLVEPLVIDNLLEATSYTVWAIHPCSATGVTKEFFTPLKYTAVRNADFIRNNCGDGMIGGSVPFSKSYYSYISQLDAQAKADADTSGFNAEGQVKANAEGTCIVDSIPCSENSSFNGGQGFPNEKVFSIGSAKGLTWMTYNAYGVPDKFQIIYKGNIVADSGYRGNPAQQDNLNESLAARGLPPELITGHGLGYLTFDKQDSEVLVTVRVFSPLGSTGWDVNMGCAGVQPFAYTLTQNFTKECGPHLYGTVVPYSKIYYSNVSYADAVYKSNVDALDFSSEGQANANLNGTCIDSPTYPYTRTENFSRNNCNTFYIPGPAVPFSRTYTSYVSVQDAQDMAAADSTFPAAGQANANATGTCVLQAAACGAAVAFTGGSGFPNEKAYDLGTGTGMVYLTYNVLDAPDKIQVIYRGQVVIDTGYRGEIAYQSVLDQALAQRGLPSEPIQGSPVGFATFLKDNVDNLVIVRVYSPLDFTGWSLNLGCPGVPPTVSTKTVNFQRNNCPDDTIPGTTSYSKSYYSNTGMQDALNYAAADATRFNNEGQAKANAEAACTPKPVYTFTRTESFTKNNCDTGYQGGSVPYNKDYTSLVSLSDAQSKASADTSYSAEGQANANANGDCTLIPISCAQNSSYSGGEGFPTEVLVNIGAAKGLTWLTFNAYSAPDKFQVIYKGSVVADSGYRGDSSRQAELNTALAQRGMPPEPIMGTGLGYINFNKQDDDAQVLIRVYSPVGGTVWDFNMGCAGVQPFSYVGTADFTKQCNSSTLQGSTVPYSQTYYSNISLADAMSKFANDQSDFNLRGQVNANNNGVCTQLPTFTATRTEEVSKNNCPDGTQAEFVTFSRDYTSTVSQADADSQAANDPNFMSDAQANANEIGGCTQSNDVQLSIDSDYSDVEQEITIFATLSSPLSQDLNVDFSGYYIAQGNQYQFSPTNIVIPAGDVLTELVIDYSGKGSLSYIYVYIVDRNPNPNGGKNVVL